MFANRIYRFGVNFKKNNNQQHTIIALHFELKILCD